MLGATQAHMLGETAMTCPYVVSEISKRPNRHSENRRRSFSHFVSANGHVSEQNTKLRRSTEWRSDHSLAIF